MRMRRNLKSVLLPVYVTAAAIFSLTAGSTPARAADSADSDAFAPIAPAGGAHYRGTEPPPVFNWTPGGFERFRVEFSTNPEFEKPVYREQANFRSMDGYAPSARAWSVIRAMGACGQPVYWRVVAKIPGAQGVVNSERTSWIAFDPSPEAAHVALSIEPAAQGGGPLTFTLAASSPGCPITGSRIDFDGDGWWDAVGTHSTPTLTAAYSYSYDTPGDHIARAEVMFGSVTLGSASAEIVTSTAGPSSLAFMGEIASAASVPGRGGAGVGLDSRAGYAAAICRTPILDGPSLDLVAGLIAIDGYGPTGLGGGAPLCSSPSSPAFASEPLYASARLLP